MTTIYLVIALSCYFSTLEDTSKLFIMRKWVDGFSRDPFIMAIALAFLMMMTVQFPLFAFASKQIASFVLLGHDNITSSQNVIISMIFSTVVATIAILFPNILALFGIIGGIFLTIIGIILPVTNFVILSGKPIYTLSNLKHVIPAVIFTAIGFTGGILGAAH